MSQVFDIGKKNISGKINTIFQNSTFLCEVFLLYNDTTVDVAHSNIECDITGNAKLFIARSRRVESETGFEFQIVFTGGMFQGGAVESVLDSASIGEI